MEKFQHLIEAIKYYYQKDERPFACGYSGGKDSTVTVDLVIKALMQIKNPKKTVFVQFSDTLMEMDNTITHINDSLEQLKNYAKLHSLPIVIKKVKPITSETFFSLIIGKGYQLPSESRWCTDRMKIRPQNRLIEEYGKKFQNGMIAVIGTRKEESIERSARLEKNTIDGIYKTHDLAKWNTLAPIENMTTDEVWNYIYHYSSEWVDSQRLEKIYTDASDDGDECRTMLEGSSGENAGCGKSARYGCWGCPKVYSKDKALNNLTRHYSYMKKQEVFRNWLMEEGRGWKNRRIYRNDNHGKRIYNRGNHRDGMVVPSGYTLRFRKEILTRLWKLNEEIKNERGSDLITYDELVFIQNEWLKEGDLDLSVEKITGKKLEGLNERLLCLSKVINEWMIIKPKKESIAWFSTTYKRIPFVSEKVSARFITTLIAELIKNKKSNEDIISFITNLMSEDYYNKERNKAHKEFLSMKIHTKKFFPSREEAELIKQEWDNDEVSFNTYIDNEIYKSVTDPDTIPVELGKDFKKKYRQAAKEYAPFKKVQKQYEEYIEKGDITMCESISLTDKIAYFETFYK